MPVEFLSDDQAARYGGFVDPPSRAQLERGFFLDDVDRIDLVGANRSSLYSMRRIDDVLFREVAKT